MISNNSLSYHNPVEVIETDNWFKTLEVQIEKLNIRSPIIVTSPGNRKRLNLDTLFISKSIYDDFGINPDLEDCNKALNFCNNKYRNVF